LQFLVKLLDVVLDRVHRQGRIDDAILSHQRDAYLDLVGR